MASKKKRDPASGDVATNRRDRHKFEWIEKIEAGMVLRGSEVKALRMGGAQIKDGYASITDGELWLHNVHIPPYAPASRENHEPERPRKLLVHRREIEKITAQVKERGFTLVPTRVYFKDGRAKIEIALGRGKDRFDKRDSIRDREQARDMQRAVRDFER